MMLWSNTWSDTAEKGYRMRRLIVAKTGSKKAYMSYPDEEFADYFGQHADTILKTLGIKWVANFFTSDDKGIKYVYVAGSSRKEGEWEIYTDKMADAALVAAFEDEIKHRVPPSLEIEEVEELYPHLFDSDGIPRDARKVAEAYKKVKGHRGFLAHYDGKEVAIRTGMFPLYAYRVN